MKHFLLILTSCFSLYTAAQLNLQWQELGPDNFGGFTTSLILDKRDSSRQTLYAGASGGGIWKSTNGGDSWNYLGCIGNYAISCITQASDGTIYFGTGNGMMQFHGSSFSEGHAGNGIYKIETGDNIIHLSATTANGINDKWAAVNRIAINPNNTNQFIAATQKGLYKSFDGGTTWDSVSVSGITQGQSTADVKWANNGTFILAAAGGNNKLVRSLDGGVSWNLISNVSNLGFPSTQGRIEITIAPSNSNIAYVNIATNFGQTYGLYKTADEGTTWDTIALKSASFDPFSSNGQGWYDNAIEVSPFDSSKLFVGGAYMYTYSPSTGMNKVIQFVDQYISSTSYLDQFGYVFNDLNPDEVYFYSDRGIYKSTDANIHFSSPTFYPKHNGLNAQDFFSVAASKSGRVMGGSQEGRGTLINNPPSQSFSEIYPGLGGFCEFSHLDTNYLYLESYFGELKGSNNGGGSIYVPFDTNIDPQLYFQPSRCGGFQNQNSAFIAPFILFETKSAFNNKDSVNFVASVNHSAGDTITAISITAQTPFKYVLPVALNQGDTLKVPNAVVSRLFLSSYCGTWLKLHAVDDSIVPDWYKISKPNFIANSYACTKNGNTLFAATSSGKVYRITGLNVANYTNWDMSDSMTTTSSTVTLNSRPIEGIAIDPNNDSILICAIAGFNPGNNVYKSIDAGNTWLPLQAGPVGTAAFSCVIDANNSNNYLVGTEHGVWSSTDAGATWNQDDQNMCDVPVYRLRQIPLLEDNCMVLYAATNSRGLWRSFTLTPGGCNTSVGIKEETNSPYAIQLFPNPASTDVTISFNLERNQEVQISLLDIEGRTLQSVKQLLSVGKQTYQINLSSVSSGFYLVQLQARGLSDIRKVSIIK